MPPFPSGNISVLHGISPVGTKFSSAQAEGPQGEKNSYNGEFLRGMIYFRFGEYGSITSQKTPLVAQELTRITFPAVA